MKNISEKLRAIEEKTQEEVKTLEEKIHARMRELEETKSKLLLPRKEEIFETLISAGGLALDNYLLAGLAIYANDPANENSNFLKELIELGSSKIPSKKGIKYRKTTKEGSIPNSILPNTDQKEKSNG